MAKTNLIVKTEVGTFTRKTARTYTHIVVVYGYRAELREAHRLAEIDNLRKEQAKYLKVLITGEPSEKPRPHPVSAAFDRECHAKFLAEGKYAKWLSETTERLLAIEGGTPITEDGHSWQSTEPASYQVLGWCGRLDLALKLAAGQEASRYRVVRIYAVATGERV